MENKLIIICSDESKWEWHSATTVKNKPNTIINGSCIHCAVEQLKAENKLLKDKLEYWRCTPCEVINDANKNLNAEISALKSKLKIAMQGLADAPNHVCGCCEDSRESVIKHCLAVGKEIEKICGEI